MTFIHIIFKKVIELVVSRLSLISCMTLGKTFNFSTSLSLHYKTKIISVVVDYHVPADLSEVGEGLVTLFLIFVQEPYYLSFLFISALFHSKQGQFLIQV